MSNTWKVWLASALMSTSFTSFAQAQAKPAAPAPAPAAAATPAAEQSFVCKDGSTVSSATSKGACTGHKGIDKDATAKAASAAAKPAAPAAPAATGKAASTPMAVAPGGGPDKVWANENTKVYHCPGSRHYGATKHGVYMTEADAKAKGMHASHNKACT